MTRLSSHIIIVDKIKKNFENIHNIKLKIRLFANIYDSL